MNSQMREDSNQKHLIADLVYSPSWLLTFVFLIRLSIVGRLRYVSVGMR
jgi:hypothetical protein